MQFTRFVCYFRFYGNKNRNTYALLLANQKTFRNMVYLLYRYTRRLWIYWPTAGVTVVYGLLLQYDTRTEVQTIRLPYYTLRTFLYSTFVRHRIIRVGDDPLRRIHIARFSYTAFIAVVIIVIIIICKMVFS